MTWRSSSGSRDEKGCYCGRMKVSEILRNAWHHTRPFFRWGRKLSVPLVLAVVGAGVGFLAQDDAKSISGLGEILLYGLAFCAPVLVLVFLWNLWLAPYRLILERVKTSTGPSVDSENSTPKPDLEGADPLAWRSVPEFQIWQVADLCGGISPESSGGKKNDAARAMLAQLLGDLTIGRLIPIADRHSDKGRFARIPRTELRRYFAELGEIPDFLR